MNKFVIESGEKTEKIVYVKDGQIEAFDFFDEEISVREGQIYKGVVKRITPGMNAAVISLGEERWGYLQGKNLEKRLKGGDEILVQVKREAVDGKYPKLTEDISFLGASMVLLPMSSEIKLSKKLTEDENIKALKSKISSSCGLIFRSGCLERSAEDLLEEYQRLYRKWEQVQIDFRRKYGAALLYEEMFALRFILNTGVSVVDELWSDSKEKLQYIKKALEGILTIGSVKQVPTTEVLDYCHLSRSLRSLLERRVTVDESISLVIEHTEAFTVIDVNSGLQVKHLDFEKNALDVNRKAAVEIVRQIRLRDLAGVILIDFIDMKSLKAQREVREFLILQLGEDRKKTQVLSMTELCILQIVRKRERDRLESRLTRLCPTCQGSGRIGKEGKEYF